jgi:hypothetical protein
MLRMKFAYETSAIRKIALFLFLIDAFAIGLMMFVLPAEEVWIIIPFGAFLTSIFVIVGISPMLTRHEVHDTYIVLRQGWYYRNHIDLSDIKSMNHLQDGPFSIGIHFIGNGTIYVNGRTKDLILMELNETRHHNGKRRRMRRVLFDTIDNEAFIRSIGRRYDREMDRFDE